MDTNQMMRDPTTANCRIYVGNLPDGVTSAELTGQFSKYGTIRGIVINRGFGFIQFRNENSAAQAIQQENGLFYQGRKLSVRTAVKNQSKQVMQTQQQQQKQQQPPPQQQQQQFQQQNQQQQQQHQNQQQQQPQQQQNKWQKKQKYQQPLQVPITNQQQSGGEQQPDDNNDQQQDDCFDEDVDIDAQQPQQEMQQSLETSQQQQQQEQQQEPQQSFEEPEAQNDGANDDQQPSQNQSQQPQQQQQQNQQSHQQQNKQPQQQQQQQNQQSQQQPNQQPAYQNKFANKQKPQQQHDQQQQQQFGGGGNGGPQDLNRVARPYRGGKRGRGGKNMIPFNPRMQNGDMDGDDQDDRWSQQQDNFNSFGGGGGGGDYGSNDYDDYDSMPPNAKQFARAGPHGPQMMPQRNVSNNMFQQMRRPTPHFINQGFGGPSSSSSGNDCEIIVSKPMLGQYAESVAARLRRTGLRCDLLYPGDDMPVGKVLSSIAARRTLYAIRVLPQNEQQRTINVFVIHSGDPNEHRNIPVEDALEMIGNDYRSIPPHIRRAAGSGGAGAGGGGSGNGPAMPTAVEITPTSSAAAPPLNQRHPDAIQTLINLIADNRPVTVLQYDRVLQYLKDRRELQLKAEIGDTLPSVPIPPPVDPELELQRKILDIMNKPSITTAAVSVNPTPVTPTVSGGISPSTLEALKAVSSSSAVSSTSGLGISSASGAAPAQSQLLADPKVQKALDSLLSGSMFNF